MNVNSVAEMQEKKSYEINKTTSIEKQNIDSTNKDKKNDTTAVIATISEDGKNRYVNEQESLIDKIEKEKSQLSSNYYLKQEDGYYYGAVNEGVGKDYGNIENFLKEDPKVLANKYMNSYSKLYNEIMQENTDETERNKKLKDLDAGYQDSISNLVEEKKIYQTISKCMLDTRNKIYATTHRVSDLEKVKDAQKELADYTKYDIPKDFIDKSINAVTEFKKNYNSILLNHGDLNDFLSNVKVYSDKEISDYNKINNNNE